MVLDTSALRLSSIEDKGRICSKDSFSHSLRLFRVPSYVFWSNKRSCGIYGYLDRFVIIFIDDILIYSHSMEEHSENLTIVLQTLKQHKLYAKRDKCDFWMIKVKFLGHVVSQGGISVDSSKVDAIINWECPKNVSEI